MICKEETFIRCRYCGRLLHIGDLEPNEVYCKKCERTFGVEECDVVLRGISTIPSDYHYEWKKEKNLEDELSKYKRAFEILKNNLEITKTNNIWKQPIIEISCNMFVTPEQGELLEELMKDENS